MKRFGNDLAAAFGLLTRLPMGRFLPAQMNGAGGVWAYPVVGLAVGALGGGVFWLAGALGLGASLAAGWSLVAMILVTGGLHEDGLADTADGFGGGGTRERKLEILRDSRIGSFGAIALILALGIRATAIAGSGGAMTSLIVAGGLGRAAMIGLLLAVQPARPDGMAAALGPIPFAPAATGIAIALLASAMLLTPQMFFVAIALALAGTLAMAVLANRQIGGHTGDVLGATEIVVECLVLSALAI